MARATTKSKSASKTKAKAKTTAKRRTKPAARLKAPTDPKFDTVKIERQGGITFLYMNRPEKRNAMSPQLHIDMNDALDHLAIDHFTEVLVLTGAGKAFSAGQDIRLYFRGTTNDPAARHKARSASSAWRWHKLSTFPKPTIAMINGFCFGGAFTQVSACGIVSWNVTQNMNMRNAMYYAVTGEPFKGKRATEIGFINKSVPKARLKAEVVKLAKILMKKSPAAMRYTKEAIRAVRFMNEPEAADYLTAKSDALKHNDREDSRNEGMRQFLDEKSYRPGLGEFKRKKNK